MQVKNNIALRDVREGALLAEHRRIKEGHSHVTAEHATLNLPIELISLFNGSGVVEVCDLTEEEREWITAESRVEL